MNNPKINLIDENQASPIKKYLFKLKGVLKTFKMFYLGKIGIFSGHHAWRAR